MTLSVENSSLECHHFIVRPHEASFVQLFLVEIVL